jgi:hypothetical protein
MPHRGTPASVSDPAIAAISIRLGQDPDLARLPEVGKLFLCPNVGQIEASLPSFWIEHGVALRVGRCTGE